MLSMKACFYRVTVFAYAISKLIYKELDVPLKFFLPIYCEEQLFFVP